VITRTTPLIITPTAPLVITPAASAALSALAAAATAAALPRRRRRRRRRLALLALLPLSIREGPSIREGAGWPVVAASTTSSTTPRVVLDARSPPLRRVGAREEHQRR